MSRSSYCAIIGGAVDGERAAMTAALAARHGMDTVFDTEGLVVLASARSSVRSFGARGVIVGDIFDRPSAVGQPDFTEAILASGGRLLGARSWGDHVALLVDGPDGRHGVRVLRSPSGGLHAFSARIGGRVVIASDIGFLLTLGVERAVDWVFVTDHLAFPHLRGARTGLDQIDEIFAGDGMLYSDGIGERFGYWSPWPFTATANRIDDAAAAAAAVREAIVMATTELASGFTDILFELSGGLDSSIVASALARSRTDATCVNFSTPTPEGDERLYARLVAGANGFPLIEIEASDDIDLTRALPAPTARPGLPGVLRSWEDGLIAIGEARGTDGFFGGTGGDNVFCSLGSVAPAVDACRTMGPGRQFVRTVGSLAAIHHANVWSVAWRALRQTARRPASARWPRVADFLRDDAVPIEPPFHPWLGDDVAAMLPGTRSHVRSIMAAQAHLDGYLRHRIAPSVFPLLAQPVIETCLRIPSWRWIDNGLDRGVARDAFAADLPDIVRDRQTKGMMNAFCAKAYQRNRERLAALLLNGHLARQGLIDRAALEAYLRRAGPMRDTRFYRVLALADTEVWVDAWLGGTARSCQPG